MRNAIAASFFFTILALGCGGRSLPRPPYFAQKTEALAKIPIEPPPGRAERIPDRPPLANAWIDGEWTWRRRRWAWIPGRWVTVPAGARYSPWCTVRAPDGTLYFAASAWRDANGNPMAPPAPLAIAGVESGAVVDAEGDTERTVVAPPR